MSDWRRWSGYLGILFVVVSGVGVGLESAGGTAPKLADATAFTAYFAKNQTFFEASTWLFGFAAVVFLLFLLGVRGVLESAGAEWRWVGSLVFGLGVTWAAIYTISAALAGAAAIDTSTSADPAAVRSLFEGSAVIFGTLGMFPIGLLIAITGFASQRTHAFPGWTAWVGYAAAAVVLVSTVSIFGGGDPNGFFTATGTAGSIAGGAYLIWTLLLSIILTRR